METGNQKLTTNFAVSNTDVITMLVVKNREILTQERQKLNQQRVDFGEKTSEAIKVKFQNFIEKKFKDNGIVKNYHELLKGLNPKSKFTLEIGGNESSYIENFVFGQLDLYNSYLSSPKEENEPVYKVKEIHIYPKFEDSEDGDVEQSEFHFVTSGDGYRGDSYGISVPAKFQSSFKIPSDIKEAIDKIRKIDNLLKNENVLKEKLISQVTENAIKQIPELSNMVQGIELLSLGS